MASIELSPLSEHFDADVIAAIEKALSEADSSPLDVDDAADVQLVAGDLDDELFAEFMDLLDKSEAKCDVYVPPDFENVIEVDEYKIGSAPMLILALEDLKEELEIDAEGEQVETDVEDFDELEEEEEDDDSEFETYEDVRGPEMKRMWELMYASAKACIRQGTCLFVR